MGNVRVMYEADGAGPFASRSFATLEEAKEYNSITEQAFALYEASFHPDGHRINLSLDETFELVVRLMNSGFVVTKSKEET